MQQQPQILADAPGPTPVQTVVIAPGNRWAELVLVSVFLLLIGGVIIVQTAVELRRGEAIGALDVFRERPTSANLRAYEHNLEDTSVFARALRPWFQFAQFFWLRDGGEKALIGRDQWYFYKPGFDDMIAKTEGRSATNEDPTGAIVAFRDELSSRGIHLLVVVAPNKESIYPDRLARRSPSGKTLMSPTTRNLLDGLKVAGVEHVDLFDLFGTARAEEKPGASAPLYLAQDSHWSPAGVKLAAEAIARRLAQLGWVDPGNVSYGQKPAPVERMGDVLRMLQSALIEHRLAAEQLTCAQVVQPDTQFYRDSADSPILVLGDSFLRIYQQDEPGSAGLIAHLACGLKQPVASLVSDGGASTLVRQELYRRPSLLKNKKVVVWEFVERDIRLGTEGWQHVPLPPKIEK